MANTSIVPEENSIIDPSMVKEKFLNLLDDDEDELLDDEGDDEDEEEEISNAKINNDTGSKSDNAINEQLTLLFPKSDDNEYDFLKSLPMGSTESKQNLNNYSNYSRLSFLEKPKLNNLSGNSESSHQFSNNSNGLQLQGMKNNSNSFVYPTYMDIDGHSLFSDPASPMTKQLSSMSYPTANISAVPLSRNVSQSSRFMLMKNDLNIKKDYIISGSASNTNPNNLNIPELPKENGLVTSDNNVGLATKTNNIINTSPIHVNNENQLQNNETFNFLDEDEDLLSSGMESDSFLDSDPENLLGLNKSETNEPPKAVAIDEEVSLHKVHVLTNSVPSNLLPNTLPQNDLKKNEDHIASNILDNNSSPSRSKYEPSSIPQINNEPYSKRNLTNIPNKIQAQPISNVKGIVSPKLLTGSKVFESTSTNNIVAQNMTEAKLKSDAYDFPLELISKSNKTAKPSPIPTTTSVPNSTNGYVPTNLSINTIPVNSNSISEQNKPIKTGEYSNMYAPTISSQPISGPVINQYTPPITNRKLGNKKKTNDQNEFLTSVKNNILSNVPKPEITNFEESHALETKTPDSEALKRSLHPNRTREALKQDLNPNITSPLPIRRNNSEILSNFNSYENKSYNLANGADSIGHDVDNYDAKSNENETINDPLIDSKDKKVSVTDVEDDFSEKYGPHGTVHSDSWINKKQLENKVFVQSVNNENKQESIVETTIQNENNVTTEQNTSRTSNDSENSKQTSEKNDMTNVNNEESTNKNAITDLSIIEGNGPIMESNSSENAESNKKQEFSISDLELDTIFPVNSFEIANLESLSTDAIHSFPGPLSVEDTSMTDVLDWLDTQISSFKKNGYFYLLLSTLKLKLDTDAPISSYASLFLTENLNQVLSKSVSDSKVLLSSYSVFDQLEVLKHIQSNNKEDALNIAFEKHDFTMALFVSFTMGETFISHTIDKYFNELYSFNDNNNSCIKLLKLIFQVTFGASKTVISLIKNDNKYAKWVFKSWNWIIALLLNNSGVETLSELCFSGKNNNIYEFLLNFGALLRENGLLLESSLIFIILNIPISKNSLSTDIATSFNSLYFPSDISTAICSQIYEFFSTTSGISAKEFNIISEKLIHTEQLLESQNILTASLYFKLLQDVKKRSGVTFSEDEIQKFNDLNNLVSEKTQENNDHGTNSKPVEVFEDDSKPNIINSINSKLTKNIIPEESLDDILLPPPKKIANACESDSSFTASFDGGDVSVIHRDLATMKMSDTDPLSTNTILSDLGDNATIRQVENLYLPTSRIQKTDRNSYTPTIAQVTPKIQAKAESPQPVNVNYGTHNTNAPTRSKVNSFTPDSSFSINTKLSTSINNSGTEVSSQPSVPSNMLKRIDSLKGETVITERLFDPVIKIGAWNPSGTIRPIQKVNVEYNDLIEDESDDEEDTHSQIEKDQNLQLKLQQEEEQKRRLREKEQQKEASKSVSENTPSIDGIPKNGEYSEAGWFGWLKKDPNEKKAIKAKLGNKSSFYYDKDLKRWVSKNASKEEKQAMNAAMTPPPPPIVKRTMQQPSSKPPLYSSEPQPTNMTMNTSTPITSPMLVRAKDLNDVSDSQPSVFPTQLAGTSSKMPTLSGKKSNGLDDILSIAKQSGQSKKKKKSGRGYVNVLEAR